jgi:hypothetical protein
MDCTLALVADSANISQEGKLNVLGSFDNINTAVFPCRHPQMVLVMRFDASRAEVGQTKQLEIRLLDPDGKTLGTVNGSFEVPDGEPGRRVTMGYILPLQDVGFEREGDHSFNILINGDDKSSVLIRITDSNTQVGE